MVSENLPDVFYAVSGLQQLNQPIPDVQVSIPNYQLNDCLIKQKMYICYSKLSYLLFELNNFMFGYFIL